MTRSHSNSRSGLTLIETLIVLLVIAILTMAVIPRALGAGRATREAALQADLRLLRQAIANYRADTGGQPLFVTQLMQTDPPRYVFLPPDGRPIRVLGDSFRGPYLVTGNGSLPVDPMTGSRWWGYDFRTGRLWSRSSDQALDGSTYADW